MNIIQNKRWFLGVAFLLVGASLIAVLVFGFRQGIDLRGGTNWQLTILDNTANTENIHEALVSASSSTEILVRAGEQNKFIVRLHDVSEEAHQSFMRTLTNRFTGVSEDSFSSIGPAIGSELRRKSMWAIVAVLLGISLYIAWAFRKVSEPVRSWKYGIVTLVTLLHDVSIPAGLMAVLGHFKGIEIDTNFIVALLVVMGFSVHDTIVVFDRIRENLILSRGSTTTLGSTINRSIKETIARSINTSLTLIIVLVALIFVGPASLFYFVLTMLVGTIFGTYSSIFVASPLLHLLEGKKSKG